MAVGVQKKVGWGLMKNESTPPNQKKVKKHGKKQLTEAQKNALEKIRKA